jgi:REP element-mobilizing transposase RayT
MGRPERVEFEGAIFHVVNRRVDRWPLFVDDADYEHYVKLLALTVRHFGWILLSFCLMPNHIHLLVQLRRTTLAEGMHWLHGLYVRWFNDRHGRRGHLFEERYKPRLVEDELYFATVVQYIENNPVTAALCESPAEWRWSSRGIVASGVHAPWLADDILRQRREEIRGT